MVGRGSFGDPWLFEQINAALNDQPEPELPPLAQRLDEALCQFTLACQWKDPKIACLEARKQLAWYFRGVPRSGPIKQGIVKINTLDDIERIIRRAKRELCDP